MVPIIALVGRPNVGKSTLFNRLTKSQQALVINIPGVTRDRIFGQGKVGPKPYYLIDTGGIMGQEQGIDEKMAQQTRQAIVEADIIFMLVDARAGLMPGDEDLARELGEGGKKVYLLVNKTDGVDPVIACSEFYALGLSEPLPIAASHNRGITRLITDVFQELAGSELDSDSETEVTFDGLKLAVIGRPNVGKSTLINRLLGEERVVVYDQPGTTRDSVTIDMEREGKKFRLIDTAGVRRRARVTETLEKFSVVKTLKSIEDADVIIFMIDAHEGFSEQDLSLIGFVLNTGTAMILAINKWDGLDEYQKKSLKEELNRRLQFIPYIEQRCISALHGTGVGHLFGHVEKAFDSAQRKFSTTQLTSLLQKAVSQHPPPLNRGRRIKLRYAHQGGTKPPRIVIHGNQTEALPESYIRYLSNFYREALDLVGTPLVIELKTGENPYKDRKNTLTARQEKKRKRLKKYLIKKTK